MLILERNILNKTSSTEKLLDTPGRNGNIFCRSNWKCLSDCDVWLAEKNFCKLLNIISLSLFDKVKLV